jgi:cAMP-specific phosphodiesterase
MNVFGGLTPAEASLAYKLMINNILATDMARHAEIVAAMKAAFEEVPVPDVSSDDAALSDKSNAGLPNLVIESESHRRTLQQIIIKAADVSNVTKPFEVSKDWASRVTEEFYTQGDRERAKGVAPLPMFDRRLNTELAQGQLGFINFVARPFFQTVSSVLPPLSWTATAVTDVEETWKRLRTPPAKE